MKPIKYFSMFSGVGGFEYGMEQSNIKFENVGYSEIDKYATSIYTRRFPTHRNYGDATEIRTEDLPDFDFLVGGFPCQSFSIAGEKRGFDDTRGTLFFEIARILKDKRPGHFLLENVRGLLHNNKGKTFQTILEVLTSMGYYIEFKIYNSKDYGVPQNRERVFLKGYLAEECGGEVLSVRNCNESNPISLNCINSHKSQAQLVYDINGLSSCLSANGGGQGGKTGLYVIPDKNSIEKNFTKINETQRVTTTSNGDSFAVTTRNRSSPLRKKQDNYVLEEQTMLKLNETTKKGYKEAYPYDGVLVNRGGRKIQKGIVRDQHCGCLQTSGIWGTVTEDFRIRRLTPVECERLQGFPDDWTKYGKDDELISDTQRYKCIGNAVTTTVITAIVNEVFDNEEH